MKISTRPSTPEERERAAHALMKLEGRRNVIAYVGAPDPHFDGHKIRVQAETNTRWYRAFVLGRWNKKGCQVKKSRVIRALQRVIDGRVRRNGYEYRLLHYEWI